VIAAGIDLVHIPRIRGLLERYGERFLARVFTPREVAGRRRAAHELAARFAAKEAVAKALGVGVRVLAGDGIGFHEVETVPDARGKPLVILSGRAADRARELGLTDWSISLSHEREYAVAQVVAQGPGGR